MQTPSIDKLCDMSIMHGISVHWHRGGPKGAWFPNHRVISIRDGMSSTQTRTTIAHELGHARRDHRCGLCQRSEDEADAFAASLLITPDAYRQAETVYGPHPAVIAEELGVTIHLVRFWRALHLRRSAA